MPTEVLRSDTFELWRQKTNTISSDLGTRGDLSVNITANGSLVTAINELQSDIGVVGSLATAATNLVGAVNELKNSAITFNGIKTFADNLNLASTKVFTIDGTSVLSATTLGSGVVNSSLTSVGTIATGVWQGTIVSPTYGGTGVNNGSRTITLLTGNLSLTAQSGGSSVTVPATGTLATLAGAETLTNKGINLASNTLTGTLAQFNAALSDDDFAGLATAQTLTNKSIALGSNTVTGTLAQFNAALTDDDFAAVSAGQTLTNKSLIDATTFIIDDAAATKRARFEASGITAGQTRVLTIQDKDGTIATTADTTFIGTTSISLSRGSGNLALAGISSVAFPGSTSGTVTLQAAATAGTTTLTMPATTGTVITSGDTGTVTNAMLFGSIANAKLSNSSVTYNGVNVALGGSGTITSNTTNALTIGDGLSGTSFNGSAAVTIAADSTIARRADTHFIGTTSVALNRTTGNLALAGISSVTLPGATSGNILLTPAAIAGTTTITLPATTGTLVTTGDSGTVSNTMLANSSITVNPGTGMSGGGLASLGGTITLTNSDRGSSQNIFKSIAVIGQTTIATTVNSDTLNVAVGTVDTLAGLTITTNAATKTLTIGHADTSSQATSTNTGGTVIQSITLDTYGHVTGLATVNAGGLYQPLDADLTAIGAIADGSTGYLKKDGANTWSLDTTVVTTTGSQALTNKTYSGSSLTVTTGQAQGSPITVSRVTNTTYASNVQDRFYIDSNGNVTIRGDLSVSGNTSISSSTISPLWANVTNKPTPTYTVELASGGPVTGSGTSTASEVGSSVTISLTNVAITDGAVTTGKIGDGQVTNAKIANTTIANAKLVNSSVTISAGTGLTDGGAVSLGGTVTLTNSDRGSSQNIFKNIAVGGQATVQADNNDDTLTLATDGSLVITTNATTDTVTIVHADTSSVANLSSDNSNGVVLQDISFTYDTYGHVQTSSVATTDLDSRYVRLSPPAAQTVSNDLTLSGNVTVGGNLTVSGTVTTVNSTTVEIADANILLAKNANTALLTNGAGITAGIAGTGFTPPSIVYQNSPERWVFNKTITGTLEGNTTTASTWQTARTLTIGNTGKPVNGSGDVSWTLAEIGAATAAQGAKADSVGAVNGIVKSNGTATFSAAVAGTDYVVPSGSISGTASNVTGTVAVANGGTGATTLTGYVKGNATSAFTAAATVPWADVSGAPSFLTSAITSINGQTGSAITIDSGSGSGLSVTQPVANTIRVSFASAYGDSVNPYGSKGVNVVLAGPSTGSGAAPTFRALVAADIPALSYVSSVGATSPVSSSGGTTPTISLNSAYGDTLNPYGSKAPNLVLATPNGVAGLPSFRSLVAADIPALNYQAAGTYLTSLTSDGLILGISGTTTAKNVYVLPQATNTVLAGPTSGVASVTPTFRSLVNADLPASGVSASTYNNVTVNDRGIVTGGSNVAYLTSYTETDTLATVTGRGNTTTNSIVVGINGGLAIGNTAIGKSYIYQSSGAGLTIQAVAGSVYGFLMQGSLSQTLFLQELGGTLRINNDGYATTFGGSVTATSLVKSGGTSSQFLKADGSVDTNAYITSSSVGNGTITVAAGTGMSGGGSFSVNQSGNTTVTLTNSGVTAINLGVITGGGSGFSSVGSLTGSVNMQFSNPLTAGITTPNALTVDLMTQSGLTAGTYNNVTVSTKGIVTAASNVSYLTSAVTSLTGTSNQVIASASTGSVTLSLPQSINTGASVQFGSLGIGTAASGVAGEIRATDNITAYYTSDERLKTNVRPIENALDKVSQLDGVIYDWNDTYKKDHGDVDGYFVRADNSGVIAQQVEKVFPNVVADRADGFKAVRYELLVPLLIEAIKDLKAEIEALKAQK